jgi:hypothetical protein
MFKDYRNFWKGYPDISQLNLADKYVFLRTTARFFTMSLNELYNEYRYLANSNICFDDKKDKTVTITQLLSLCDQNYLIKDKFWNICAFVNKNISLCIDLNTRKTNLVFEKIACNMVSKLPVLTHNEKAQLMANLHFNILDAEYEWRNYYATNILHLPF